MDANTGLFLGCKLWLAANFWFWASTALSSPPPPVFLKAPKCISCKMHLSDITNCICKECSLAGMQTVGYLLLRAFYRLPSAPYLYVSYLPVYLIVKKCVILRSWKMCFSDIANCMHRVFASCWLFTVASLLPPSPSAPTNPYWETPLCVLLASQHPPFILPPVLTP